MKRLIDFYLNKWKDSQRRKPLIVRGARQVGKTYSIRNLGEEFEECIEINFELTPSAASIFDRDLKPDRILRDLGIFLNRKIIPGKTLLFFDEIQEAPKAIKSLRYFYELMPELHIVAAGSLLEFQLENIGMPVGRVSSLYIKPVSFIEFLCAKELKELAGFLLGDDYETNVSAAVHEKLLQLLGEYLAIGGMPEAVDCWVSTSDYQECVLIQQDILEAYKQDFSKYVKKYQIKYVDLLFNEIPSQSGRKFIFSHLSGEYRARDLTPALDLLVKADMVYKIYHTAGNGLPLGAEINLKRYKLLFLDIALHQYILGLNPGESIIHPLDYMINNGALAEVLAGQELSGYSSPLKKSHLYYWHREAKSSNAEVDYVIVHSGKIIPLEIKAGKTGRLKSLHQFLEAHPSTPYGLLFNYNYPDRSENITSLPLYAFCRIAEDIHFEL